MRQRNVRLLGALALTPLAVVGGWGVDSSREWAIPNASLPLLPAIGPDGKVYITVRYSDRIARFDPATEEFAEWRVPRGTEPHGLLVDGRGQVWFTGSGNGRHGRLDPETGSIP